MVTFPCIPITKRDYSWVGMVRMVSTLCSSSHFPSIDDMRIDRPLMLYYLLRYICSCKIIFFLDITCRYEKLSLCVWDVCGRIYIILHVRLLLNRHAYVVPSSTHGANSNNFEVPVVMFNFWIKFIRFRACPLLLNLTYFININTDVGWVGGLAAGTLRPFLRSFALGSQFVNI